MSDAVRISVIIPAYNAESTLQEAVSSVLAQRFSEIEVVIVDDGSTDGTGAICDALADGDERVRVVHQPNRGVSAARNAGLARARGDYIAWLDSDDAMDETMLEKLYAALTDTGADIAMCNYENVFPDGRTQRRYDIDYGRRVYPMESMIGFLFGNLVPPVVWCNLIPRRLYEGIRFPEGRLFEDVRTTYRLFERAGSVVMLSEPLARRSILGTGLSNSPRVDSRVDGCLAYMERYEDAVARWPQYRRTMLVASAKVLRILRRNILGSPRADFDACRGDIQKICAFHRDHRKEILPADAGLLLKLEYRFLTAGTRRGFVLSRLVDCIGNRPDTYLHGIPTPDMPPI